MASNPMPQQLQNKDENSNVEGNSQDNNNRPQEPPKPSQRVEAPTKIVPRDPSPPRPPPYVFEFYLYLCNL